MNSPKRSGVHHFTENQSPFLSIFSADKKGKKLKIEKNKKKTLFEVMSNFYLTKKFINTLKMLTSNRTPKFLSEDHFAIINDLSFFFSVWKANEEKADLNIKMFDRQNTHTIDFLRKKTKNFLSRLRVFESSSSFMIIWSVVQLLLILYFFFTIPLEAAFNVRVSEEYEFFYYLEQTAIYFFICDVLLSFNTAVYLKGKLTKERVKIAKNYLKNSFIYDIIGVLCILLLKDNNAIDENFFLLNFIRIVFFLKMINFSKIIKKLEEMFFIDQSIHNILALLKLIFRIMLLSHIFACLWFYIGTLDKTDSWIISADLFNIHWLKKYLNSYYFVCVTMLTVGYGDLSPRNSIEKLFAIIFIYIACGIFAYSINKIGVIVAEIAKRENKFQKDLNIINEFMKQKEINFDLRMRVRKYLDYIWYEEKIEKIEEQTKIINKLSDSLKEELLLEANADILRNIKTFAFNFSEDLLRNTIPLMREARFTPGDLIFMKGDVENKDFYLIRKGKVEIFLESTCINAPVLSLKILNKGDIFGEISFFSDQERRSCARSIDFTTVYIIKRDEFLNLLEKYPRDYQKFCEIKDNINLYSDFNDLYMKCYSCKNSNHMVQECPLLNYKPIRDILLKRFYISIDHTRQPHVRKKFKFKARMNLDLVEKKAYDIQSSLLTVHDSEEDSSKNNTNGDSSMSMEEEEEEEDSSGKKEKDLGKKEDFDEDDSEKDHDSDEKLKCDTYSNLELIENSKENKGSATKYLRKKKKQSVFKEKRDERKSTLKSFNLLNLLENFQSETSNSQVENSRKSLKTSTSMKSSEGNKVLKTMIKALIEIKDSKPSSKIDDIKKPMMMDVDLIRIQNNFDLVKSWEFYFPHNNCEIILIRFNFHKNKHTNTQIFPSVVEKMKRKIFKNDAKNGSSIIRKNFFKNRNMLEEFINETEFNGEKFKCQYKKKLHEKNQAKKILNNLMEKISSFFKMLTQRCFGPKKNVPKRKKKSLKLNIPQRKSITAKMK